MGTLKIFNFPVMRIEINVVIRKFLKRIEIGVNNRNFTKWIEISVSIWKFTKWIKISVNIGNFTKWIEVSVNIRIERKGLKLVWPFEIPFSCSLTFPQCGKLHQPYFKVQGKTTYEWHTDRIGVHMVICGSHTSTYEWLTNNIQIYTSDVRMAYE